jgi:hypothetical protein
MRDGAVHSRYPANRYVLCFVQEDGAVNDGWNHGGRGIV